MPLTSGPLLIAGVLTAAYGCATAPKPAAAQVDPDRTILDLRAKNAGYVKRIEELENRVFILEDQLDSRALAAEQRAPATLPKLPPISKTADPDERSGGDEPVQTSLLAEHAVDYAGEAAATAAPAAAGEPEGKRPFLRLSASGASSSVSRAPEPRADAPARPASNPLPLKLYREALEILRSGHPQAARVGFRRFLDANPQHDYADNAQYWIGECEYAAGDLGAAERAFRTVVERYPRGNKVPDAMLKLGYTLQALGDDGAGRAVLESLTRAFPRHEAARLAATRLARPEAGAVSTGAGSRTAADKILGTIAP